MALGEIARQIAGQAIRNQAKEILGTSDKPATPAPPENACTTILGQIQAMQKALKEDEELVVLFHAGTAAIRVMEFFVPSWQVIVLKGVDAEKNLTRVVAHVESLQLVTRVAKVQPPAKPARVGFVTPKAKTE
jgi:hypothetical protein